MWKNRIIGYEEIDPTQLLANPRNWRIHPQQQQEALEGVLEEVGWVDDIIVNKRTGFVLDGHLRAALAISQEQKTVPIKYIDVSEDEEMVLLATFDPIAAMAATDKEKLDEVMQGIDTESEVLKRALRNIRRQEKLDYKKRQYADAQWENAQELQKKWKVKRGQIWGIDNQRLMCGDSTSIKDTNDLLDGELVDLGVTSPPYLLDKEYEEGATFEEHLALLKSVAQVSIEAIRPGGFFFINFSDAPRSSQSQKILGIKEHCVYPFSNNYWDIFYNEGFYLYATRVWYKGFSKLATPFWSYKTSQPHHNEFEHLWTWRKPGGDGDECFNWDISSRAVWDSTQEHGYKSLNIHVAAFPVYLPRWAILAHSAEDMNIWDPFGGAGTTLIACIQTNRKGYGMEIVPEYCAVTLERFVDMGLEPRLVETKAVENGKKKRRKQNKPKNN